MAKRERTCFCCGAKYRFCGHGCKDEDLNESWRFLFDNENCKVAYDVWQAYRGNETDKDTTINVLKNMNIDKILKADTMVSKTFKEILAFEKKEEAKAKDEKIVETPKKREKKAESESRKNDFEM